MSGKKMYGLIVEWDGQIPDSKWYSRLNHFLANNVRGTNNRNLSPTERRTDDNSQTIVAQEGMILFSSPSTRDIMYKLALEVGEAMSKRKDHLGRDGRMPEISRIEMTFDDSDVQERVLAMANRLEAQLSVRGRPPAPRCMVVSCNECLASNNITASRVTHCPTCSSVDIRVATDTATRDFYLSPDMGIFDIWTYSRFDPISWDGIMYNRIFLDSKIVLEQVEVDAVVPLGKYYDVWQRTKSLAAQLECLPFQTAIKLYDAIFTILAYHSTNADEVDNKRGMAIANLIMEAPRRGITLESFPEFVSSEPDLFTAAYLLDSGELVDLYLQHLI